MSSSEVMVAVILIVIATLIAVFFFGVLDDFIGGALAIVMWELIKEVKNHVDSN